MELTLERFVKAHAGRPRDEFLATVTDPHLLTVCAPDPAAQRAVDFRTLRLRPAPGRGASALIPVRKLPESNPFAKMITVGRAANNDIVLPCADVSKLHCYFHRFHGSWTVCDPGSTNGTVVDGVRVLGRGTPVRSGAVLRLADAYELVFLEPADLSRLVTDPAGFSPRRLAQAL